MIVQGKSLCMVPHLGVGLLIKYEMSLYLINIFPVMVREFKPNVYGRQQTVNITSVFLFFSCYP